MKGKNKKERALFVVDRLYDDLFGYLAHPQSPKGKKDPLFPVESGKGISRSLSDLGDRHEGNGRTRTNIRECEAHSDSM